MIDRSTNDKQGKTKCLVSAVVKQRVICVDLGLSRQNMHPPVIEVPGQYTSLDAYLSLPTHSSCTCPASRTILKHAFSDITISIIEIHLKALSNLLCALLIYLSSHYHALIVNPFAYLFEVQYLPVESVWSTIGLKCFR